MENSDDDPAAGPGHPVHLAQGGAGVLHVAQAVGDGDHIEAGVGEGQGGGVPGHEADVRVAAAPLGDHAGGEVAGHHLGAVGGVLRRGGAGARGQVEDPGAGGGGDGGARDRAPHVDLEQAHDVVGQVVAACHGIEHPGDLARVLGECGAAGGRAHGPIMAEDVEASAEKVLAAEE